MIRVLAILPLTLCVAGPATAAVQTKQVTYKDGNVECRGLLAWDDAVQGPRPGVLVVHEWWGLDVYAKNRAEQLAGLGYIALAADMYGDGKTTQHPDDARKMATEVRTNVDQWRRRALGALDVLKAQPQCDKTKLAAIGYCFGGSTCQQLAYAGTDLKAVVSFHGALVPAKDSEAKQIKAAIVICHGADDPFIPAMNVKAFRDALDKNGVKYEFHAYPGVVHSFTVPQADSHKISGMKYDKAADEASWKRMREVFAEKFRK